MGKLLLVILGWVLGLAIPIVLTCLLAAWLCDIDPEKTYTWYSGMWHGLFCIPNWIRSFFSDDVLCKANNYTTAYNVWWWIVFLDSLLFMFIGKRR